MFTVVLALCLVSFAGSSTSYIVNINTVEADPQLRCTA